MQNFNSGRKSHKLLFKTLGASTVFLVLALGLLGYISLYSKQKLAMQTAEFMGQSKLLGDMTSFEFRIATEYGDLNLNSLKSQYKLVDEASRDLGVVATIFMREGNDFRRITTSISDKRGRRAVDTFLGSESPAYSPVMAGKSFSGTAKIFNVDYLVTYKPVFEKGTQNVIGILFLGVEMEKIKKRIDEDSSSQTLASIILGLGLLIVVIMVNAISIGAIILRPISKVTNILKDISEGEGDLTQNIPIYSNDEVGMLAQYFNKLMDTLKGPIGETKTTVNNLASASEELSSVSRQLTSASEDTLKHSKEMISSTKQTKANIETVAQAAKETSLSVNEVASAAEQMSANMNTIAAAIEEMSASISEIADNAKETRHIAGEANEKSSNATTVMNELGIAAKEIGQVTDVIKKIADKTNLLALNATIEAASAGEAGKGFAVVASEIKELANQSAQSADDITNRIDGIQNSTGHAVVAIRDVGNIIEKINLSIEAIAGHVGQQTKASNEIASNVSQANLGAKKVASSIGEIARSGQEIANNANDAVQRMDKISSSANAMNQVAQESNSGSSQVNSSANDLAKMASDLRTVMGKFRV
jgi:methyl-accepting chemotaxis protein